jgi:hypothetical protein
MKQVNFLTIIGAFVICFALYSFNNSPQEPKQFEFTSFTVIESIIPGGIGRSRIINSLEKRDYKEFTKEKSSEDRSRNRSKRGKIRVFNYEETKLLNFYNLVGIRFQNIAANDAIINDKVSTMMKDGKSSVLFLVLNLMLVIETEMEFT